MPQATILTATAPIFGIDVWTVIFTLVNLLVIYLVLKKFLYEPVKSMMKQRTEDVEKMYADADEAQQEAIKNKKEYEAHLNNAKKESQNIIKAATQKANLSAEDIIAKAQSKATHITKKAKAEIETEKRQAVNTIKNDVSDIAILMAEKIVSKELDKKAHEKLIEDFIENVGEEQWLK